MAPTLGPRSTLTDDDTTGTTGSIWNNSELQKIYDNIDAEIAAAIEFGGVLTAPAQLRAIAYRNAAQTIVSATLTAVTFNTEDDDVGGLHDNASNPSRMTIPAGGAGLYLLSAKVQWAASAAGTLRLIRFAKNGTTIGTEVISVPTATTAEIQTLVQICEAAAADYFEVICFQDSGGGLNIGNASREQSNEFAIVKLW